MSHFKEFEEIQVGDTAVLTRQIVEEDVRRFVELTGDDNPLHVNRAYAETTPFKDIVVHGMLGASFLSTLIGTQLPGKGALWVSQTLDFLLPVRVGDTLTVSCTVEKKHERERLLDLQTRIENQGKRLVLSGKGVVKVLARPEPPSAGLMERLKVAVVAGGAGGIGRAICLRLARAGHRVVVGHHSRDDRAAELVNEIVAAGGEALAVRADVTVERDVTALVDTAVRRFSGLSLLVFAASPPIQPAGFEELSWESMAQHLDTDVKGAFLLAKKTVPHMRAQGYGKIINITSQVLDGVPPPKWSAYAVGKAGLAAFSRCLAVELGPAGITVNCVSPGMTETAMIGDIPEKMRLVLARQAPLRRLGRPQDVAEAVAFLASPEADYITGETLRVNGGQMML
jgi:3-oxoacyl-[acyl-carrier protein] reductase